MTQSEFELILLQNKPPALRIEHARIPTDKIVLDPHNPRLKNLKELNPGKADAALLTDDEEARWLKKDIAENGVIDPIYVRLRQDGSYLVVEGNRRTVTVQGLHAEFPDDERFNTMPARILPEATTETQEALLMASFHVTGKVKWDAHEKAQHIYNMVHRLGVPESELSNILHMGVPAIKRNSQTVELFEGFKKIDGGKYAARAAGKWSFFAEFLRIKTLREKHERGPEFSERFMRWVGDERIPRAENVRDLESILKNSDAKKLFEESEPADRAFEKALQLAQSPGRRSKFFKHLENMIVAGRKATVDDIDQASNDDTTRELVMEAYSVLSNFMERANVHRPGPRRVA
jgi:hypothetical protein